MIKSTAPAIVKRKFNLRLIAADGRFIIAFSVSVFFLILCWAYIKSYQGILLWEFGVPVACCPFFDLKVLTAGLDNFRLGNDPLAVFPKNTSIATLYNYPRLWYYFSYVGIREEHTSIIGLLLIFLFFFFVFKITGKITWKEGILYSLVLCSPSVVFLLERGNSDIVMFILIAFIAILPTKHLASKILAGSIFLIACFLKLFPIFAIGLFLKFKQKAFLKITSLLLCAFIIYVLSIRTELSLIRESTPRALVSAFGGFVLADNILVNTTKAIDEGILAYELNPAIIPTHDLNIGHMLALVVVLGTALTVYFYVKRRPLQQTLDVSKIDLFRIGAGVYMGTYLLGNNWDYRLTFLFFTTPQIIIWCKSDNFIKNISIAVLLSIILCLWNPFIYKILNQFLTFKSHFFVGLGIEEILNYFLFIYFFFTFIQTLPDWLKEHLFLPRTPLHHSNIRHV